MVETRAAQGALRYEVITRQQRGVGKQKAIIQKSSSEVRKAVDPSRSTITQTRFQQRGATRVGATFLQFSATRRAVTSPEVVAATCK